MSKNGTKEAIVEVPVKDARVIPAIEKRLEALRVQEQEAAQQVQLWATKRSAAQGAILTLEALREELAGETEDG